MNDKKGNDTDDTTDVNNEDPEMPALEDFEDDNDSGDDEDAEERDDPEDGLDELKELTDAEKEALLEDTAIVRNAVTKVRLAIVQFLLSYRYKCIGSETIVRYHSFHYHRSPCLAHYMRNLQTQTQPHPP